MARQRSQPPAGRRDDHFLSTIADIAADTDIAALPLQTPVSLYC